MPRSRVFTLKDPSGKVILKDSAPGAYFNPTGSYVTKNPEWQKTQKLFSSGGFDQKVLSFDVTPGKNDFMVQLTFAQPKKGAFKDYVGMGSQAVFCPDPETAKAIKGGTMIVDGEVF